MKSVDVFFHTLTLAAMATDGTNILLSNRIRKIREAYGLTQSEVADRMDISYATYGEMERNANHSSHETLSRIAAAIDVSLLFLLDTDNKNYKEEKNSL
jgi:transcriptional regulator with XRE-family HTH domain